MAAAAAANTQKDNMAVAAPRDLETHVRYLVRDPTAHQPDDLPADPWISGGADAEAVSERKTVHVTDIRALKGGVDFDLDVHGFTFHAPPPQPEGINSDDENVRAAAVEEDYGPKVVELAKKLTGAEKGFLYQFLYRGSDKGALDWHVHCAHSDYSPKCGPTMRKDLIERFGMSEEEAQSCDFLMLNMWHPRNYTAWTEPLALLDFTSLDEFNPKIMSGKVIGDVLPPMTKHTKEFYREDKRRADEGLKTGKPTANTQYGRFSDTTTKTMVDKNYFKEDETFLNGPTYYHTHKWVYCSDMEPNEAWFFKQFDTRDGVAKVAYHNAVVDPFHMSDTPAKPFRRSLEVRVLLTFPKKNVAPSKL